MILIGKSTQNFRKHIIWVYLYKNIVHARTYLWNCNWMYFPNRELLWFLTVDAFPEMEFKDFQVSISTYKIFHANTGPDILIVQTHQIKNEYELYKNKLHTKCF